MANELKGFSYKANFTDSNGNVITSNDFFIPKGKDAPKIVGYSEEDYDPNNMNSGNYLHKITYTDSTSSIPQTYEFHFINKSEDRLLDNDYLGLFNELATPNSTGTAYNSKYANSVRFSKSYSSSKKLYTVIAAVLGVATISVKNAFEIRLLGVYSLNNTIESLYIDISDNSNFSEEIIRL